MKPVHLLKWNVKMLSAKNTGLNLLEETSK